MEQMRLTFLHCVPRCTPPHFVVNVMKMMVLSVLIHTLVGAKLFICTMYVTCVEEVKLMALVLCCVLCREGFGVDSGLLWGLLQGRVKLGLKSRYLVQKQHAVCTRANTFPQESGLATASSSRQ